MSRPKQHYLYIPGLGDGYDAGRRAFITPWRWRRGVQAQVVSMHWLDGQETFSQKQMRIAKIIDSLPKRDEIILVGESAGGSMAISMMNVRPERISKVVTVCGLNLNVHNVSPRLLKQNPAFGHSVRASESIISQLNATQKDMLHTIYSTLDPVVTKNNSLITGVRSSAVHYPGHMWSIVFTAILRFSLIRS